MGDWKNRIIGSGIKDPKDLQPNPKNWRKHPKDQALALEGVLEEVGWIQDVIVNQRTGRLIDGHLRVELAVKKKEKEIPVKFVDLSEEEEEKALLTLDPITSMAVADKDRLQALLQSVKSDDERIKNLMDEIGREYKTPPRNGAKEDDYTPPPEIVTDIKPGDIYRLGRHRIMCGDATNIQDVERLIQGGIVDITFTSPPYNVGVLNIKGQPGTSDKYIGGEHRRSEDNYGDFINTAFRNMINVSREVFINIGLVEGNKRPIIKFINNNLESFKDIIYWVKDAAAPHIQPGVINNRVEPIYCFGNGKRIFEGAQFSQGTYFNVISGGNASGNEYAAIHKATFPIYFPSNIIENFCKINGTVFDPFLGSGTTLIACEQLDRICYGMEISPQYCEIICQRWEQFTGQKRVKV